MKTLAIIVCLGLAVQAFYNFVITLIFVRLFYFRKQNTVADGDWPRTAVLMALKGTDPFLHEGVKRLAQQDYPDFELRIVIHSRDDPAWEVVHRAVKESGATNVRIDEFRKELDVYGLNCNSAKDVQSVKQLDDSFELIAFAEGDLMVHRRWLREMVAPMVLDERVGATFGNRWYMPPKGQWGSLIRYMWNVGAVVLMYLLGIPWGGSMAMRTSIVREENLTEEWARTVAIDQTLPNVLKRRGLHAKFVPSLMIANREECDLGFCMNFLQRQMTWARVYHPRWRSVVAHCVSTSVVLLAPLIVALAGLVTRQWQAAAWAAVGYVAYHVVTLLTIGILETGVRQSVRGQDQPTAWLSPRTLLRLQVVLMITQWVYLYVLFKAMLARYVRWRGITLEILGRNKIRNADAPPIPN